MPLLMLLLTRLGDVRTRLAHEEDGFSTAELLGNAALGIVALVVIWGAMRTLGLDVVAMVREQILTGS